MDRLALFCDTQNLYYAARDGFDAHVDYETLQRIATDARTLAHANAYVVERDGERGAYGFVTKLSALGYRVHRRLVRLLRTTDGGAPELEGDWDMGIAADMVRAEPFVDVVVLASGDGDFVPIVRLLQERGVRVEVVAFRAATAQELIDACDRFTDLGEVEGAFVGAVR
ncbi:MAG: NYN domain-containing protein [Trueperaceae bacterium]|nr:NYN domain-containing protein [Trueperaceae bacterium]